MKVFEKFQMYNPRTGQPVGVEWQPTGAIVCDYCGSFIDTDDDSEFPCVQYKVIESGGFEPQFSEDNLVLEIKDGEFVAEKSVDLYELFSIQDEFAYCAPWANDCESKVLQYRSRSPNGDSLCWSMYACRYEAIKKAIASGVTHEQLRLILED